MIKALAKQILCRLGLIYRPSLLTRSSVVWAYRLFLDRNPESRSALRGKLRGPIQNVPDLRRDMLFSREFAERYPDLAPFPLRTVVLKELPCGRRLFVDLGDTIIGGAIARDVYERDLLDNLPVLVQPGTTALDIGANIGFFTIHLAHLLGETGQVVAFEPIRELMALLEKSVGENHFEDRVVLEAAAVGDKTGHADMLYVHQARNQGASYLVEAVRSAPRPSQEIRRVPMVALDSYPFKNRVSFIKIDVEGAEPLCIKGCSQLLERDRPIVVSEVHPFQLNRVSHVSANDYLAQFASLHYRPFLQDGGGCCPVQTGHPITEVSTLIFIPAENESAQRSLLRPRPDAKPS